MLSDRLTTETMQSGEVGGDEIAATWSEISECGNCGRVILAEDMGQRKKIEPPCLKRRSQPWREARQVAPSISGMSGWKFPLDFLYREHLEPSVWMSSHGC